MRAMYPDLFHIGPFTLHTYGLFAAIGFWLALMVTVRLGRREGIAAQTITDLGFCLIVAALIGSRLLYVLLNPAYFAAHPWDVFKIWQGGLVFSGGILLVLPTLLLYLRIKRLPFWTTADLFAPGVALGQAIGRIGCFMAGCCYGAPSQVPWRVVFTDPRCLAPLDVGLHPTQLYASFSSLAIFLALLWLGREKQYPGQVMLWYLILHSTARLFLERFRGDDRGYILAGQMSLTQLVALGLLLLAIGLMFHRRRKCTPRTPRGGA